MHWLLGAFSQGRRAVEDARAAGSAELESSERDLALNLLQEVGYTDSESTAAVLGALRQLHLSFTSTTSANHGTLGGEERHCRGAGTR